MRWLSAFAVTAVFLAIIVMLNLATDTAIPGLLIVVGSAIWAAVDSSNLELHKYKGQTGGPVVVFIAILALWLFTFPLYLVTRSERLSGNLKLKKQYRTEAGLTTATDLPAAAPELRPPTPLFAGVYSGHILAAPSSAAEAASIVREQLEVQTGQRVAPVELREAVGGGYMGSVSVAGVTYAVAIEPRDGRLAWRAGIL